MSKENLRIHQEKFYNRYVYLAEIYVSKVNNYEKIAMERQDIVQELKMKIWTSVESFLKKWKEYRNGGYKPVPMKYYIMNALNSKIKDWYRAIERETKNVPFSQIDFDYGINLSPDTDIDFPNRVVVIQGVDILRGMLPSQKDAMIMYLKGHKMTTIRKVFSNRGVFVEDVSRVIKDQVDFVKNFHPDLNNKLNKRFFNFAAVEN